MSEQCHVVTQRQNDSLMEESSSQSSSTIKMSGIVKEMIKDNSRLSHDSSQIVQKD